MDVIAEQLTLQPLPNPQNTTVEEGLIFSSQGLGWDAIVVKEYQLSVSQCSFPAISQHDLTLCLAPRPHRIHQVMETRRYVGIYSKGDICITPAGIAGEYRAEAQDHYLQVQIEPQFLQQVAQEIDEVKTNHIELRPKFHVRHPHLENIIMMLHSELTQGKGRGCKLYIESLMNALAVNLLRDYCATNTNLNLPLGGLSDRQLLKVTEYINDNLSHEITLANLSELIGISKFHFSRLFKQSVGTSPHQYLMRQRIEHAKLLLKNHQLSVIEVALCCGFNSHSHFGKYFRQITGLTPKEYRISVLVP